MDALITRRRPGASWQICAPNAVAVAMLLEITSHEDSFKHLCSSVDPVFGIQDVVDRSNDALLAGADLASRFRKSFALRSIAQDYQQWLELKDKAVAGGCRDTVKHCEHFLRLFWPRAPVTAGMILVGLRLLAFEGLPGRPASCLLFSCIEILEQVDDGAIDLIYKALQTLSWAVPYFSEQAWVTQTQEQYNALVCHRPITYATLPTRSGPSARPASMDYMACLPPTSIRLLDFLRALCHTGVGPVPRLIFSRAASKQYRWRTDGGTEEKDLSEAGLSDVMYRLLSDEQACAQAIHDLEPLVLTQHAGTHREQYIFAEDVIIQLNELTKHLWKGNSDLLLNFLVMNSREDAQALMFHIFPRDEYLEPSFREVARTLAPHIKYVMDHYVLDEPSNPMEIPIVDCFLALIPTQEPKERQRLLKQIEGLALPRFLQLYFGFQLQRSLHMARIGNVSGATRNLQNRLLEARDLQPDGLLNSVLGLTNLALAESEYLRGDTDSALQILAQWTPRGPISVAEGRVVLHRHLMMGKIENAVGQYLSARNHLQHFVSHACVGWSAYAESVCELADAHRSLGEADVAYSLLAAVNVVELTTEALCRWSCSMVECQYALGKVEELEQTRRVVGMITSLDCPPAFTSMMLERLDAVYSLMHDESSAGT